MKKLDAETLTVAINKVRLHVGIHYFTKHEFIIYGQNHGVRFNTIWPELKNIFLQSREGKQPTFAFPLDGNGNAKPIYKAQIEQILDKYHSKTEIYAYNEENAIKFLKSKGYKIYKPNIKYEEI